MVIQLKVSFGRFQVLKKIGLIYHPLNQKYTTNAKDNKFVEYKWKPAWTQRMKLIQTQTKEAKKVKTKSNEKTLSKFK